MQSYGQVDLHLTFAELSAACERNAHQPSNPLAIRIVDSGCVRRMDGHPRGSISRASRILPEAVQGFAGRFAEEVLLPVYLRLLLQPLCGDLFPVPYAIQATICRLAGILISTFCAGLDLKYLHEYLQPAEA